MHKHSLNLIYGGLAAGEADKALLMVHGRGGTAKDILGLASHLNVSDFLLAAPQAGQNTWYPYSFMAPAQQNEPSLSSALEVLAAAVKVLNGQGFSDERICFLGFSQGACLLSEFLARRATKYGAAFILSGGLIGSQPETESYRGDFSGTPVFFGVTDSDPHVPFQRVEVSKEQFDAMGAKVTFEVYPGRPHSIYPEEIVRINEILLTL